MKTILLILLFASVTFGQNLLLMDDETPAEKLAKAYQTRVLADGGAVISYTGVVNAYETALSNGTYISCVLWVSPNFGVKKDANNKVTKLYNLIGTNDPAQADTSKAGTWTTSGMTLDGDDNYPITALSLDDFSFYLVHNIGSALGNALPLGTAAGSFANMYRIVSNTQVRTIFGGTDVSITHGLTISV